MKRTDSRIEQEIVKQYLSGKSMKEVGAEFGVNAVTVMNILNRLGIPKRTKGGIEPLDEDSILRAYSSGLSAAQIAPKHKVCRQTIDNVLNKHRVNRNKRYENTGIDVHYFKSIDSPDKAYFLGYLLTDGNVAEKGNIVKLQLHQKDSYILELFAEVTGNANRIFLRKDRPHKTIRARVKEWKTDLAKYGVVPRKTYIADLPLLPDIYMPHLIRGMIDGDGWVSCSRYSGIIGFCGAEKAVSHLRDYLHNKLGITKATVRHVKEHLWRVCWGAKKDLIAIGNYIYKNKDRFYLRRKYENFLKIKARIKARSRGNTEVTPQIAKGYGAPQSVGGE